MKLKNKTCSRCYKELSITKFYKRKIYKDGLDCWCKKCRLLHEKEHRKKNKRAYRQYDKRRNLKCKYNLTVEEYNKMLELQGGKCAICGKTTKENKRALSVDHDHKVQKKYKEILIRGLLCTRCNHYIMGILRDNKEIFKGLIKYLTDVLKQYENYLGELKNE